MLAKAMYLPDPGDDSGDLVSQLRRLINNSFILDAEQWRFRDRIPPQERRADRSDRRSQGLGVVAALQTK